VVIAVV